MICLSTEVVEIPPPSLEVVEISPPPRKKGAKDENGVEAPTERVSKVCVYMGVTSGGIEGEKYHILCTVFLHSAFEKKWERKN